VRSDAMAAAQLRAPLFEDKVVDYLFSRAEVTDRTVPLQQLQAEIESEDGGHVHGPDCNHDHDHDHDVAELVEAAAPAAAVAEEAPKARKVKGKKVDAESVVEASPDEDAAPAKKPRAKKADAEPAADVAANAAPKKSRAKKQG
jgi:trigger factor